MKTTQPQCREIEALLTRQMIEPLPVSELRRMQHHLETCASCRQFRATLVMIEEQTGQTGPTPNPSIQETVRQKLISPARKHSNLLRRFWQFLLDTLSYRIPLYQAAVGVIILFLALYSTATFRNSTSRESYPQGLRMQGAVFPNTADSLLQRLQTQDNAHLGRNLSEDSTLSQYMYISM